MQFTHGEITWLRKCKMMVLNYMKYEINDKKWRAGNLEIFEALVYIVDGGTSSARLDEFSGVVL